LFLQNGTNNMQQLNILNGREIKKIKESLIKQFNYAPEEDYAYLQSEKDRIFIVNKDIAKINLKNLIIDKMGLYFAEVHFDQVRLSKEGAELLWLEAKRNKKEKELKNVVELSSEELKEYFRGLDLTKDLGAENKMILLRYQNNVIGCAKYKEGKILNFMPKIHRGEVII